jgi:hypothetical protein
MTTLLKGVDVRTLAMGLAVSRATNTLPQTATGNIFVVSGGRVIVRALVGEVTTVFGATVTSLSIGSTPTVGSASNTALGTLTAVTSLAVGGKIYANPGGATVVDTNGSGGLVMVQQGFLVPIGNVTITTNASDTGSAKWDILYVPLDPAAVVTAA